MKFHHKKEVSLEETPILLRLERRHTLAGGRDPDPERPLSRANSVGSFTGLMGTPESAAPPIHKCRSESKRNMLSRAPTIVITENELASSLLYNNRKAKMLMEVSSEAPTPVSSPQPNSTRREVPSVRPLSPRPKPSEFSKTQKKGRSICCSYAMIALFICLASLGILMAIGGIIYMELFSAHISFNKDSLSENGPGDNAFGDAEGRLLNSLYEDEKSSLEANSKEDQDDPILGLDGKTNLREETSFLEKLGEALSNGKPSHSEASEESPNLDLSLNLRDLLNKALFDIPKELSKMLPPLPDLGQKEQKQGGQSPIVLDSNKDQIGKSSVEVPQNFGQQELNEDLAIKSGSISDNSKSSVTYVQEVVNPQESNEYEKSEKSLTGDLRNQKKEGQDVDDSNKRIPVSDDIKESSVSYVVSNTDADHHQELQSDDEQVQEVFVPFDHADDHAKENLESLDELSANLTESRNSSLQKPIIVDNPSHVRDGEISFSENNHIDDSSRDFVTKSPITEVKSVDESKALPFEFFRRLGFDRDTIMSNPLLSVDDMNVKFSINEALKVLKSLENNLPSSREKSSSRVPKSKVRPTVPVHKKMQDVGKERREYLLKLRRNMLFNLNRF